MISQTYRIREKPTLPASVKKAIVLWCEKRSITTQVDRSKIKTARTRDWLIKKMLAVLSLRLLVLIDFGRHNILG